MKHYKTTAYPDGVAFNEMTVNGDYFYIALEEPVESPAGAVEITAEEFAAMVALEEEAEAVEFIPDDDGAVLAEILLSQIRLEEYANNQDDTNAAILLGQAEILANMA